LRCRVFLPARSAAARRDAIAGEGAEVVVVDGSYEDAVAHAEAAGAEAGCLAIADVGETGPARWVIDGYATLFAEVAEQGEFDVVLVPTGVGSLAAAAARHGAAAGAALFAFEYGLVGRRRPLVRALPALPQLADQVVFGVVAGGVLSSRRRARSGDGGRWRRRGGRRRR
jgi:hypothetical protein